MTALFEDANQLLFIIQNHTFHIEQDCFPQDLRSTTSERSSYSIRSITEYLDYRRTWTHGIRESSQVHHAEWTVTYLQL